jgi:nucleotide-binding universal stress UspA family protein
MILCATDLSESARAATDLAAWLARRFDDTLVLMTVVEPTPVVVPEVMVTNANFISAARDAAEAHLQQLAESLRREGLRVDVRAGVGDAATLLLDAAHEGKARFITMGTHGRKGAARLFLGSVAERVSSAARCPVIVTGPDAAGASRWPASRALNLAVATDGSSLGQAAIDWVADLQHTLACEVTVIRLYSPPREAARYGLDDPWLGKQGQPQLLQLIERDLRRSMEKLRPGGESRIRFVAVSSDPAAELAPELVLLQPDALVIGVGAHRMTWPDVHAPAVLRSSPVPVICVPAASQPVPAISRVRSVLVATDFTAASEAALRTAYALLRPHGGRVELCTVHERGPAMQAAIPRLAPPLDDKEREKLEARLRALIPADADATGIATRPSVVEGNLAPEAILQAAERLGVDLVVLASHGRAGIRRAILGSTAEEVARHARVPVVIVHTPGQAAR